MKLHKVLSLLLVLGLMGSLMACSKNTADEPVDDKQQGQVEEQKEEQTEAKVPYVRVAGYTMEKELPVAVWVDFDPATDVVLDITLTGYGNPVMMEAFADRMESLNQEKEGFIGKKADELLNGEGLAAAIAMAAESYLTSNEELVIRPYQSMATERYLANNPYIIDNDALTGNVLVKSEIVAQYPADAASIVTENVISGEDVKYPAGMTSAAFAGKAGDYTIDSNVLYATKPGIVVISYEYGDHVVYDAVDVYENFTLNLEGQDAYGKVIGIVNETDAEVTYRVLGDKAMNFPGGTCGSTVIDVVIDKANSTIAKVEVVEHSDSTYLANEWEYSGGFVKVGEFIYNIDKFTDQFIGKDATTMINPYVLSTKENPNGGEIVEGGVEMVVTGATRTPNAIIYAVNAAIEAYMAK